MMALGQRYEPLSLGELWQEGGVQPTLATVKELKAGDTGN